mgnify:CR=1 FL=1
MALHITATAWARISNIHKTIPHKNLILSAIKANDKIKYILKPIDTEKLNNCSNQHLNVISNDNNSSNIVIDPVIENSLDGIIIDYLPDTSYGYWEKDTYNKDFIFKKCSSHTIRQ